MRPITGRVLAVLVFLAVLAFVPSALAPAGAGHGPYVSALLDLTGGAALAGPQCPNKGCVSPTRCGHVAGAFGCTVSGGTCQHGICR